MNQTKAQVVTNIGNAVFEALFAFRKQKTPNVKITDKGIFADQNPAWLDTAIILRDYFISSHLWSRDDSVLTLVQQATKDLQKAILKAPDFNYRAELIKLQSELIDFLINNNCLVPKEVAPDDL